MGKNQSNLSNVAETRDKTRDIRFTENANPYGRASVTAEFGRTKVHITASVEQSVPPFLRNKGRGWVTAEYSMLPGSTDTRTRRDRSKIPGRTMEIQRLIGRSLRAVVDMEALGERTVTLDCDVLVADGGTRTASVSGAYVALKLAVEELLKKGAIKRDPIKERVAAVSVGIDKEGNVLADLDYGEDSGCTTDMNVVMTKSGKFIEIQGTAEGAPFSKEQLDAMLGCARTAIDHIFRQQENILGA